MEVTDIFMIHDNLAAAPVWAMPEPYTLEFYQEGNERDWVRIHEKADKYNTCDMALFDKQFAEFRNELGSRMFFLKEGNKMIGTATAWSATRGDFNGYGQVHWVAIVPEYQGKGLGKPLVSAVVQRIRELRHTKVYLVTDERRPAAIRVYEGLGFKRENS